MEGVVARPLSGWSGRVLYSGRGQRRSGDGGAGVPVRRVPVEAERRERVRQSVLHGEWRQGAGPAHEELLVWFDP
mgnify:CR=1 FL=1